MHLAEVGAAPVTGKDGGAKTNEGEGEREADAVEREAQAGHRPDSVPHANIGTAAERAPDIDAVRNFVRKSLWPHLSAAALLLQSSVAGSDAQ